MKFANYLYLFLLIIILSACNKSARVEENFAFPFQDNKLTIDERVNDLIGRLTLDEKVSLMMHDSPEIERLGIPAYNWWNEALHGVARSGSATVFPQAIGLGATFDDELAFRVSNVISDEARALYHASVKRGNRLRYAGLTFWTPNVNIFRDPRWGRGMETYGEDPYLTARIGVSFVKGLQGNNPNYLKSAACGKHYVVHSGPEGLRHEFNAISNHKDLVETYFPAFEALVKEANVEAIMCAYNRTNDEPCCGSNFLLNDVLRTKWGFKGHVVSDCWGLVDFHEGHKVTATAEESAAMALKSGVNLNCGAIYNPHLAKAVRMGLVTEDEVDASLATLLRTRFRLGFFDEGKGLNPYEDISTDVINSDKHRNLAREVAQKSIVLLKNSNNVLPLSKETGYVFVLGPNANHVEVLLGNYYGLSSNMSTILEGITAKIPPGCLIQYKKGFLLDRNNINPIDWTSNDAKEADVSIVVMGLSPVLEGEEGEAIASPLKGDRPDYQLPANQIAFLKKMKRNNPKPVIAVITGGSPMDLSEVHEIADAVLLVWYPGEEGGNAVGDVLFGDVVPSGRLPLTFPKSLDQLPPFEDYSMVGRTYRYMTEEPMYPFGYGLSYTSFSYADLNVKLNKDNSNAMVDVKVKVTNTGNITADEVVQLYITLPDKGYQNPLYSLKGMKRVNLQPGKSETVSFQLSEEMLQSVNMNGDKVLETGDYKIYVGGSSPGGRSEELGVAKPVQYTFKIDV